MWGGSRAPVSPHPVEPYFLSPTTRTVLEPPPHCQNISWQLVRLGLSPWLIYSLSSWRSSAPSPLLPPGSTFTWKATMSLLASHYLLTWNCHETLRRKGKLTIERIYRLFYVDSECVHIHIIRFQANFLKLFCKCNKNKYAAIATAVLTDCEQIFAYRSYIDKKAFFLIWYVDFHICYSTHEVEHLKTSW